MAVFGFSAALAARPVPCAPRTAVGSAGTGARQSVVVTASAPSRRETRKSKHMRIRSKLAGTQERPRLSVYRSSNHIYAQVIDDTEGRTLAAVSTLTPAIRSEAPNGSNQEAAQLVGKVIAEKCKAINVEKVRFDRGGYVYHGRVKALADAAREAGLVF